ncbi:MULTISPECIES: hypothetical protein [Rhizobium]|uniref:Membrane protein n=1 Tax=Rhizobium favelukesii TaxID=348824 RepID=W6RMN3_9HYPH|nr:MULTISPECIES: hypothetical protein [Rhizobium]MCS0458304.1 hypothetical protein [Rhizobium favelukesii]UFS79767.1 hypothetical protein LPB79_00105 [Rhizobium sp. T136]CDM61470.1 putative membrane protein [Rhizobium favelukesii]
MTVLVVAAIAYLTLALILVYAIDNLVALFFPDAHSAMPLNFPTLEKMMAASRKYYRK